MEGITSINASQSGTELGSLTSSAMGKDEFLTLLVQQLKHQDPLSPMESQDFSSQLAQFSSLEQLTNMTTLMEESMNIDLMLTQAINNTMATSFIGKEISAIGDSVTLPPDGSADLSFKLGDSAKTVVVRVVNSAGNTVREIEMGSLSSGKHNAEWDGLNNNGERTPAGDYTFEVEALDGDGNAVSSFTMITGTIDGIQYDEGGAVFIVNGNQIPFNQIMEIKAPEDEEV